VNSIYFRNIFSLIRLIGLKSFIEYL